MTSRSLPKKPTLFKIRLLAFYALIDFKTNLAVIPSISTSSKLLTVDENLKIIYKQKFLARYWKN
ncbi:hypothetical protein GCM10019993_03590 [Enterococcus pseudoavium]